MDPFFRAGRLDDARDLYLEAADLAELADSDYERARACTGLGNVAATCGDTRTATNWWAEADGHEVRLSSLILAEVTVRAELQRSFPRHKDDSN